MNGWMKITATSPMSIELLQVRTKKNTIGLGSSKMRIERNNANGKCNLHIFIHLDDELEPITLRLRTEVEPFHEWERTVSKPKKIRLNVRQTTQSQCKKASANPSIRGEYENRRVGISIEILLGR